MYIYMYMLFFNHSVLQFVMMLYNVVSEKDLKLRQVSAWMSCVNVYTGTCMRIHVHVYAQNVF